MKQVVHRMDWQGYAKGVVSAWPDNIAQDLVTRGLANYYEQPEPAREAPVRRGIADKLIRKVAPKRSVKG